MQLANAKTTSRIVIFGCSNAGLNTLRLLREADNESVVGFSDNNDALWASTLESLPVVAPADIPSLQPDMIIIASQYYYQIKPQLEAFYTSAEQQPVIHIAHRFMREGISLDYQPFTSATNYQFEPVKSARDEVFYTLCKSVEQVYGYRVEGDFAEFGCGSGQSSCVLAQAINQVVDRYPENLELRQGIRPSLHLFDSFLGLPEATADVDVNSLHVQENTWDQGACFEIDADTLESVLAQQYQFERVNIYDGWFEDTMSSIPKGQKFALVHLDCDLYQSTYDVLDYLIGHRHLAEGAMLLFDDWSCNRASPNYGQQKAWADISRKYLLEVTDFDYYGLGAHRKIFHRQG